MWKIIVELSIVGILLGAPSVQAAKPTGTPGITLSVPSTAKAGDTVTVTITPVNGAAPSWVAITTDRGKDVGHLAPPTLSMKWTVPADLSGTVNFIAIAGQFDTDLGYSATAKMQIGVTDTLQSLELEGLDVLFGPPQFIMDYYKQTRSVGVLGHYSDGVVRDLSSPASGTTFSSSNTNVVQILADGSVQAVGSSSATVTVTNSGISTSFPVTVNFIQPRYEYAGNGSSNWNANTALAYGNSITVGSQIVPINPTLTLPVHATQASWTFYNNSGLPQLLVTPGTVVGSLSTSSAAGCAISFTGNSLPITLPPYAVQQGTVVLTLPPKGGKCVVSLKIAGQNDSVADKFTITNPAP